uniref:Osteoclast stimulatory transmembrane protein-like n=1 Tax=Lepisosteus oculatus TaxID=7918 RepID=W5M1Z4_LEPOC
LLLRKLKRTAVMTWDVYSKPTPSNWREGVFLFLLCLSIALSMGGLFHTWLVYSLQYGWLLSSIMAGTWALCSVLLLFLVHPARCVFTIIVPSLVTKQGRKILISTALMIVAANCIPNTASNINAVVEMIKCASEETTETTLNSTNELRSALSDIENSENKTNLHLMQDFDISEVKNNLKELATQVKKEFSAIQSILRETSNVTNKIVAALFLLYLFGASVGYLVRYLTDLKHDNVYVTHKLLELAEEQGLSDIPSHYTKKLVRTTGWKMTGQEMRRGLWGIMVLSSYGLISAVIIGLDYFIYFLLQELLTWASDIPDTTFTIDVGLNVELKSDIVTGLNIKISDYVRYEKKSYSYSIPLLAPDCVKTFSRPNSSAATTVGSLYLTAFIMLLVDVYARRVRRKISASFYKKREEERICYLLEKIMKKT